MTDNDDYSTVARMVERLPASVRRVVSDVDGSYSASAKPHLDGFGPTETIGIDSIGLGYVVNAIARS